jgi:regulator of sigma E protease
MGFGAVTGLTILVFAHELGHYSAAWFYGVKIEVFSIGFGPELFGWWDRAGTRWKISAVPLGGYVKLFGDTISGLPAGERDRATAAERAVSFSLRSPGQRAVISAGGPLGNLVFAILVLALLFMSYGQPSSLPEVDRVVPGSAAAAGGIRPGDVILSIDGHAIRHFADMGPLVRDSAEVPLTILLRRDGRQVTLRVTPRPVEVTDQSGRHSYGRLGIHGGAVRYVRRDPWSAVALAVEESWNQSRGTLDAVWQMTVGRRAASELGGPLAVAQLSGEAAGLGIAPLLWLMGVLSVNLGLINLFPVPVLDGGHLLFYAAEAIRGKPLGRRVQKYCMLAGLAAVLALMVFATWNDLVRTGIVATVSRFAS